MKAVVLILRGCPAGWLGAYGNEWVVTPHLDRLAAESVVFDRHITDCPLPEAANRAWLGGDSAILSALADAGVKTILVRANHVETDALDRYYARWGEVFDARPEEADPSPLDALLRSLPRLLERMAELPSFLLWIEIDRLLPPWEVNAEVFRAYLEHEQHDAEDIQTSKESVASDTSENNEDRGPEAKTIPEPMDEEPVAPLSDPPTGLFDSDDPDARLWLATSFGAVVTSLDSELGELFEIFRSHGLDRSATWIITSDFGYPLGEHGQIGVFRPWLHEELVHLPLFMYLPESAEAGRRVHGFTQPEDIASTLLELFRGGPMGRQTLLSLARGEVEELREAAITSFHLGIAAERSVRTNEWCYISPVVVPNGEQRTPQLFQKPDDRWEVNDLLLRNIEIGDELEARLREP